MFQQGVYHSWQTMITPWFQSQKHVKLLESDI